jgi:hypothetical protein
VPTVVRGLPVGCGPSTDQMCEAIASQSSRRTARAKARTHSVKAGQHGEVLELPSRQADMTGDPRNEGMTSGKP